MAATQVTRREYARFCDSTRRELPPDWRNPEFDDPDQPVVSVSWFDAVAYCEWVSRLTGGAYRLPTEAEWEWAALSGKENILYPWGDEQPAETEAYKRRWTGVVRSPRRVAEEPPNAFGIYDLCENVHEWCADWYDPGYYAISPEAYPQGPPEGTRRASRGGSWRHHIKVSRCAARSSIPPEFKYADYGFRVVRSSE